VRVPDPAAVPAAGRHDLTASAPRCFPDGHGVPPEIADMRKEALSVLATFLGALAWLGVVPGRSGAG